MLPLRCDLLTGTVAVEVDQRGKPAPVVVRELPEGRQPCPLCGIVDRWSSSGALAAAGDVPRGEAGPPGRAYAVDNRWKLLDSPVQAGAAGPPGRGQESEGAGTVELVLAPEHLASLEELDPADARALITLLLRRQRALASEYGAALAFMSVGVQAGSSLPHLHGQVAAFSWPPPVSEWPDGRCAVCDDVARADEVGRVMSSDHRSTVYVPWVPAMSGEVRIALAPPPGHEGVGPGFEPEAEEIGEVLADALVDVLHRLEAAGRHWPYQVVLHPEHHPHAHLLPRLDLGMVYPRFVGVMPLTFDHTAYARELRVSSDLT